MKTKFRNWHNELWDLSSLRWLKKIRLCHLWKYLHFTAYIMSTQRNLPAEDGTSRLYRRMRRHRWEDVEGNDWVLVSDMKGGTGPVDYLLDQSLDWLDPVRWWEGNYGTLEMWDEQRKAVWDRGKSNNCPQSVRDRTQHFVSEDSQQNKKPPN